MSRRKARRQDREAEAANADSVEARSTSATSTPSQSPMPKPSLNPRSQSRPRNDKGPSPPREDTPTDSLPAAAPAPPPMPPARPPLALLVCSLGNPGPSYANTLHSAGHTVLARLAQDLGYPPFVKERGLGNGLASRRPASHNPTAAGDADGGGGDWTLWQSPSYMNVSGPAVRAAWKSWSAAYPAPHATRLVVVHDELEAPLGSLTVRTRQGASARGHNGLKSLMGVMGGVEWVRAGVGIGRPESREKGDVSAFVLRRMSAGERGTVEGCVSRLVEALRGLERGEG